MLLSILMLNLNMFVLIKTAEIVQKLLCFIFEYLFAKETRENMIFLIICNYKYTINFENLPIEIIIFKLLFVFYTTANIER